MSKLWDSWLPGALSRKQLRLMCEAGLIGNVTEAELEQIDHSSLDLHLTEEAYRLTQGSVKPSGRFFLHNIKRDRLVEKFEPESDGTFILHPRTTYLFGIREHLEELGESFWGQATAKSSVGRLDVLARLIVNGMNRYEGFEPTHSGGGTSELYVEVTPITFPVKVRKGVSLNQVRLFYGHPRASELSGKEVLRTCYAGDPPQEPILSVDLSTLDPTGHGNQACGFSASEEERSMEPVALWDSPEEELPDPSSWWQLVVPDERSRVRITKNRFYIFRSEEKLCLPPGIAVYARAIDEEIGEMRIHYAGFVHPNFGRDDKGNVLGTPLIFEVRGHNVDVSLRHSEILARLNFYRMSEDSAVDDGEHRAYNEQTLKLSKYFSTTWSSEPSIIGDNPGSSTSLGEFGNDA